MSNTSPSIQAGKDSHSTVLLSALLTAHFNSGALMFTPREAYLQTDKLAAGACHEAAHATLASLMADGLPVYNALAIVTDALKHRWSAAKLRQLGATIHELMMQGMCCDHVAGIAERVINSQLNDEDINDMFAVYLR